MKRFTLLMDPVVDAPSHPTNLDSEAHSQLPGFLAHAAM